MIIFICKSPCEGYRGIEDERHSALSPPLITSGQDLLNRHRHDLLAQLTHAFEGLLSPLGIKLPLRLNPRNPLAVAGNDDRFALFYRVKQAQKSGFRFRGLNCLHFDQPI
ncbi:MAG TPA: hypothetical protein VGG26_13025 [Terracidiphilus sp.]